MPYFLLGGRGVLPPIGVKPDIDPNLLNFLDDFVSFNMFGDCKRVNLTK